MAIAITSFIPTTGSTAGGTSVVITGTQLDLVDDVLFGNVQGRIDTTAANSATTLTVISPAVPNADAGTVKISVIDLGTSVVVTSSGNFTYTSVATPVQTTNLAKKWKLEVSGDDGSTWLPVKGITNFQPAIDPTTQDDSDFDSGDWGSDVVTMLKWSLVVSADRKTTSGYTEDPGQALLRTASDQTGANAVVYVRWYDRNGGDEAYSGHGNVKWSEKGGSTSDKSTVDITVMGRGARATIVNPAA